MGDIDADGIRDILVGSADGLVQRYDFPPPTGPDLTGTVDTAKAPANVLPGGKKNGSLKGLAAVVIIVVVLVGAVYLWAQANTETSQT